MVLTRSGRSGSRKVPRRPPSSSNVGRSAENPISVDPIDAIPLAAIPSSTLIPFNCPASLSRSSVVPKAPKVEAVSTGPSTLDHSLLPPPKPFATPVSPYEGSCRPSLSLTERFSVGMATGRVWDGHPYPIPVLKYLIISHPRPKPETGRGPHSHPRLECLLKSYTHSAPPRPNFDSDFHKLKNPYLSLE